MHLLNALVNPSDGTTALRVEADIGFVKTHTRRTAPTEGASGHVDVYEVRVEGVNVVDAPTGTLVMALVPGTETFDETAKSLLATNILPETWRRVPVGGLPPARYGFAMPYDRIKALVDAKPWLMKAIDEDDEEKLADHAWLSFEAAAAFDSFPCGREEFDGVMEARKAHSVKTTKADFFLWYGRSRELMSDIADGVANPERATRVDAAIRRMADSHETDEAIRSKLRWHHNVHPMHVAAFDAYVSDYLEALNAAKAAPVRAATYGDLVARGDWRLPSARP